MNNEGAPDRPNTRIQREKREIILDAALEIFSTQGFRGSTIDEIAEAAAMSKPNLLYYFRSKEEIYTHLLHRLLDTWLAPLMDMDSAGDPVKELRAYIRRKIEMARDFPRESRLFANEILRGAPAHHGHADGRAEAAGRREGRGDPAMDGRGQADQGRPLSPDLRRLGDNAALRRFRRAGAGGARR